MNQQISPKVLFSAIALGIVLLGVIGYWVYRQAPAPSVTMQQTAADRRAEAGGPTPEALRKRDEYNKAHPDAAGSR